MWANGTSLGTKSTFLIFSLNLLGQYLFFVLFCSFFCFILKFYWMADFNEWVKWAVTDFFRKIHMPIIV